ncbi:hypothetical protein [Corynebacterium pygosceleis]|uniref:Uncharacterized protein n=1 Tax=Corynebacterium pygosceleis TaxID=2800406 RepID=A0A9Q4C703_9CORY|nr:hypothetical protein [Corynebacterium pygosceleis]MCK7636854.1 hypothetical protein [Corynebacterium pygosceleis]MCK7674328.1 hypothetical protein [Corynebacterium pygosceleis]MCL0120374.1 hypothetical protein [Corynebacterium pygosceleis]MCX7443921.1 hypothetical protein [Corynebacterium pygosceleis]MCX7467607.1 hypothetical protein [Corynebacterium pygosceleis]
MSDDNPSREHHVAGEPDESAAERRRRLRAEKLAPYMDDLPGAERRAAQTLHLGPQQVFLGVGMVGFLMSLFLPHSGQVLGLDVLFFSDTARAFVTTWPERIYVWTGVIGVLLLTGATVFTRSALIACLAWLFSGACMFYSLFAIWMRQSRPPTEPGAGPSYGLVIGAVSVTVVALALTRIVLRRSSFQSALAEARRQAPRDDEVQKVQEELLAARVERDSHDVYVDERRSRAAKRRRANRDRAHREGRDRPEGPVEGTV